MSDKTEKNKIATKT